MALGNNYITLNGMVIPNPKTFKISYQNMESVKTSEVGTDIVLITRLQKRTFDMQFQTTTFWGEKLREMAARTTEISMDFRGETIPGRFRFKDQALENGSEFISGTDGLWTGNFQFIET